MGQYNDLTAIINSKLSPHFKEMAFELICKNFFGQKCILDKRRHVPMSDLGSCRVEHKP